jgi:hypothetical protein
LLGCVRCLFFHSDAMAFEEASQPAIANRDARFGQGRPQLLD